MPQPSRQEQFYQDSCGTLATLSAHGFARAWGLYAYPGGVADTATQDTVDQCYSYGRTYGAQPNNIPIAAPYLQRTISVIGGKCNDPTLPCSTITVANNRTYMLPSTMIKLLPVSAAQWAVVQTYRLVSGSYGVASNTPSWDCTDPNPKAHWTTIPETYCLVDLLTVAQAVPAGTIVTDPAGVAIAAQSDRVMSAK